ncbi:MAG: DNA repair exonuclease [Armatimonadetes bacterium]|nr:DNA repair exonuclease [Armatimonadota bacterium]NCO93903.1 DNA repair exonuclease [Armatimonadota bacterium]NCP31750.1 DNA repair exonuclease [Armatimonadota bacterium]NCQ26620.1 DNA repair exonuclease [Armatimonadota bacterium]NDK14570.1 DNA repair exonuclease [Armatimonadota bacterium]
MTPFRFVHCADLHIDSPFRGVETGDAAVAERLRRASFEAFDAVVNLCLEERVDCLLIAGDVFDSADRSLRAQFRFLDQMARLSAAGIDSFVVHGNHDPLDGWIAELSYPERVTIFGPEVQAVPLQRRGETLAVVHGVSYPTRNVQENLALRYRADPGASFNIGLLHCNAGADTGHESYAPCTLQDLSAAGMDYWALGHVHRPRVLKDTSPTVCYPGTAQGRSPVETGEHGCYLAEVDETGHVSLCLVPTDSVRWQSGVVALGEDDTLGDVRTAVGQHCEALARKAAGRDLIVRLTLEGRTNVSRELHRPGVVTDLVEALRESLGTARPFVWLDRLTISTRTPVDRESRSAGQDFVGELLRQSQALAQSADGLAALRALLQPVFEHSRAPRHLREFSDPELAEWLSQAESRCLDLLVKEGEG